MQGQKRVNPHPHQPVNQAEQVPVQEPVNLPRHQPVNLAGLEQVPVNQVQTTPGNQGHLHQQGHPVPGAAVEAVTAAAGHPGAAEVIAAEDPEAAAVAAEGGN